MSVQKKSYRHEKRVDNFNDELLNYIISSVYDYPEGDEPKVEMVAPYAEIIQGAKTRREAKNRLINAAMEKGVDFFTPAISDYNNDYGNEDLGIVYNTESFDPAKLKMAPILAKEMPIEDANAYVDKLAKLMGYRDNGVSNGAAMSLLKDYYGEGFLNNLAGGHAGDYSFYKENRALADALKEKFKSIDEIETLKRELGYNPEISIEDLLNVDKGIPSFTQRAYRSHARKADTPNKAISFIEGLAAAQTAGALDEGQTPGVIDIGTDVAEAALLGPAKTGKAIMKTPIRALGFQTGLDVLHDMAKAGLDKKTYSEGDMPITSTDGAISALNLKERAPQLAQALLIGKVGSRGLRALEHKLDNIAPKNAKEVNAEVYERLGELMWQKNNPKAAMKVKNSLRKSNGMQVLSEKEFKKDIDAQIMEAKSIIRENNRKTAMQALFGGAARTGIANTIYNPQSSPAIAKRALDILSKNE